MNSNTVKIDELKQNNANPSPLTVTFSKRSLSPGLINGQKPKNVLNHRSVGPERIRTEKLTFSNYFGQMCSRTSLLLFFDLKRKATRNTREKAIEKLFVLTFLTEICHFPTQILFRRL